MNIKNAKSYRNSVLSILSIAGALFAHGQSDQQSRNGETVFEHKTPSGQEIVFVVNDDSKAASSIRDFSSITKSSNVAVEQFKDGEVVSEETPNLMMAMLHNPLPVDTFYQQHEEVLITKASRSDKKEVSENSSSELKPLDIKFYPNPNQGKFNLSFILEDKKSIEVRIIDLLGNQVYRAMPINFPGYFNHNIDISDQSTGIYFLQIVQGNKSLTQKIIIQ